MVKTSNKVISMLTGVVVRPNSDLRGKRAEKQAIAAKGENWTLFINYFYNKFIDLVPVPIKQCQH
jgi:hypothetical protein